MIVMLNKLYKIFKNNLHLILPISFFAFIFSAIIAGDVLAAGDIQTNFQVPFGEVKTGSLTTIAQYVNAVYKYLVAAGGVLAGIMFAVGGFMYITSAGDSGKAKDGRKYIINAILGLLLLVSSYVVLDTINPNATVLKDIAVKKIDRNALTGSLGCPCNSDSDCDSAVFCSLDPVPFNADYAAPDWVQGIEDTAKFIGEYGDYAVIAVTLGAGIYMALLKTGAKKAITASAKSVVKKMIAKITKAKTALKAAAKQISLKTVTKAGLKVITTTLTKSAKLVLYPILHPVKFATKIAVVGIGITIGIYTLGGFS